MTVLLYAVLFFNYEIQKKICLNLNSQNSNSRIRTEFESLFECYCCCGVDLISLLLTIEEIVQKLFSSNDESERYSYLFKGSEGD